MVKWIAKRVLANPLFIELLIEIVVSVQDKQITDVEKDKIKQRALALIGSLMGR